MQLYDKFSFGKYKGLTLHDVFFGIPSHKFDRQLLRGYVNERMKFINLYIPEDCKISFEIGEYTVRVVCDDTSIGEDLTPLFDKIFSEQLPNGNHFKAVTTLHDYNIMQVNEGGKIKPFGAFPMFLHRCLEEEESFYISEKTYYELVRHYVYYFVGLKFKKEFDNIYYYEPIVAYRSFNFLNDTLLLVKEKYKQVQESGTDYEQLFNFMVRSIDELPF